MTRIDWRRRSMGLVAVAAMAASGCSLRDTEGLQSGNEACDHDCDGDGVCEDLRTDVGNCGACGYACVGDGSCVAGSCRVMEQHDLAATALTYDDDYVYGNNLGSPNVWRWSRKDGSVQADYALLPGLVIDLTVLAGSPPRLLALRAAKLDPPAGEALTSFELAAPNQSLTEHWSANPGIAAALGTNGLYVVWTTWLGPGEVKRASLASLAAPPPIALESLASGQAMPKSVVITPSSNIPIWVNQADQVGQGELAYGDEVSVKVAASALDKPVDLALAPGGQYVYWLEEGDSQTSIAGGLRRMGLANGVPTGAVEQLTDGPQGGLALAVTTSRVYWTTGPDWNQSCPQGSSLWSIPADAGQSPQELARAESGWCFGDMLVDGGSVFWMAFHFDADAQTGITRLYQRSVDAEVGP